MKKKNIHAVRLGRLGGKAGTGKAKARTSAQARQASLSRFKNKAFTLIELLVVIGIVAVLLGMIFPAYFGIQEKAKVTKAKVEVKNLETAFKNYLDIYRAWPSGIDGDRPYTIEDNRYDVPFFSMLQGTDKTTNPQGVSFYEFSSTNNSRVYDPWTNPGQGDPCAHIYYVMFDANYDNKISGNMEGHVLDVYRSVIVWSSGPNGTNEYGEGDDITSWK